MYSKGKLRLIRLSGPDQDTSLCLAGEVVRNYRELQSVVNEHVNVNKILQTEVIDASQRK